MLCLRFGSRTITYNVLWLCEEQDFVSTGFILILFLFAENKRLAYLFSCFLQNRCCMQVLLDYVFFTSYLLMSVIFCNSAI